MSFVKKPLNPIEIAPITNQTPYMTNFKGVGLQGGGDTHFSHVKGEGFHVTTRLQGGIDFHDNINDYFKK